MEPGNLYTGKNGFQWYKEVDGTLHFRRNDRDPWRAATLTEAQILEATSA